MKHKVLALVLCFAMLLTMTLPGTLAVSVDAEDTSDYTAEGATPAENGEAKEEQNIAPASLTGEDEQDENNQEETPTENPEEKPEEGKSEEKTDAAPENPGEEKDDTDDLNGDNSENAETVTLPECSCPEDYQQNTDYDHDTDCARNIANLHELTNEQLALLWTTLTDTERAFILSYANVNGFSEEQVAYMQQLEEGKDSTEEEQPEEEKPEGQLPAEQEPYSPITGASYFNKVAPLMNMQSLMTLDDYGRAANDNNDVVLNKTAKANTDGSYTITLEAYATGASHTESHYDPADIVLVLDTSGSMKDAMSDEDLEPIYSSQANWDTGSKYILLDGEYVKVTYTGSRWAILTNGKYGNEVIPKSSQNDNTTNYVRVFDGIDTSKTYYVQFTQNNKITYQAVTYQTTGGRNGWYTQAGKQQTPRTDSTSSGGTIFYQQQQNTQFYNVKANGSRLYHLMNSVNSFIDSVLTTSPEGSIAIVNFGSEANMAQEFSSDKDTLKNAVNNLTANGATKADTGMSKAKELLSGLDATHTEHKKVVIMFTDGVPTSKTDFETDVANAAINAASEIKGGATVYTIGVFDGANGALSSFTTSDVNKYMHLVSSNYPNATSMTETGEVNSELNGKSYYLSASNSAELMSIFQLISQEVGGATNTTLGTETVIKDIIAPSFTVPANTSDIKVYTANCTGAGLTFGNRTEVTSGITTTITGDTLDVKGFDFSANWCGDHSGTYGGKKLIIEFTVSPKTGFLGGNDVPTNGEASGMYSDGKCIGSFDVPTVNVPIADITIEASDKNVYLTQVPSEEQLKDGVTVKCGTVDIADLSELEDWQKAYVTIESSFTKAENFDATEDGSYTVTAKITPKTDGSSTTQGQAATEKTGGGNGQINVFKPELTFKDSTVYYGEITTGYYGGNLTNTQWKHGETNSTDEGVTMIGTAPDLSLTFDTSSGINDRTKEVVTKEDIPVKVTVDTISGDVTEYTTFVHTKCSDDNTCTDPENAQFWLHVKTCSLTIGKKAGTDTTFGDDEYFVFNVKKDGEPYTQVTIKGTEPVTIYELPVGNYTVEEDASTAWRYTSSMDKTQVELKNGHDSDTITCTNTKTNDKWLNHFARVINTYGVKNED